jgi:hypothetical protein
MSTDDTVNAYMRNVGEMEGVRHRAEKAEARIVELERERDELRAALGKIALLDEYDGPVVAGSYIDLARAALKAPR